jgi:NifU-like domain
VRPQVRPYLMSDGGNVEFVEIDGPVVYLRLQVGVTVSDKAVRSPCAERYGVMPWGTTRWRCKQQESAASNGSSSGDLLCHWRRLRLFADRRIYCAPICCRVHAAAARPR